jgi:hypothetical protein
MGSLSVARFLISCAALAYTPRFRRDLYFQNFFISLLVKHYRKPCIIHPSTYPNKLENFTRGNSEKNYWFGGVCRFDFWICGVREVV